MNASSPTPDDAPHCDSHPVERRLQRLQPQRLALTAESVLAAADITERSHTPAAVRSARPAPAAVRSSAWSLMAVGLSGFAAGILLTYGWMRPPNTTRTSPTAQTTPTSDPHVAPLLATDRTDPATPSSVPSSAEPATSAEFHAAPLPDAVVRFRSSREPDPWQAWWDLGRSPNSTGRILAVRGTRVGHPLAGLSPGHPPSSGLAPSHDAPTLHRGMDLSGAITSNRFLDDLLGPL